MSTQVYTSLASIIQNQSRSISRGHVKVMIPTYVLTLLLLYRSPAAPDWFRDNVQVCYQWFADGDGGQCGGGADQTLCAGVGNFTAEYRDDTDNRGGGCRMSWMLSVPVDSPQWLRDVQLCYHWFADGNGGQCGGGVGTELCAQANSWTTIYRDDTDNRGGGCQMAWQITTTQPLATEALTSSTQVPTQPVTSIQPTTAVFAPDWFTETEICYKWRADSNSGECGVDTNTGRIVANELCASTGELTTFYRDDTDSRTGGCRMQWGIRYVNKM